LTYIKKEFIELIFFSGFKYGKQPSNIAVLWNYIILNCFYCEGKYPQLTFKN